MARPCASTAGFVRICAPLACVTGTTRRWLTPQLWFSRLPKFVMSMRNWPAFRLPPMLLKTSCDDAQVHPLHHREEHAAALRVLAAVLAQVLVLVDVRLERLRLLVGRERAAAPA